MVGANISDGFAHLKWPFRDASLPLVRPFAMAAGVKPSIDIGTDKLGAPVQIAIAWQGRTPNVAVLMGFG
jgi:hypothetical protein